MSITQGYFKNSKRLLLEVLLIGSLVLIPHTALALGLNVDGDSSYALNSPASINYGSECIGYFSSGSFFQNGGSNTASSLYLGFTPSGSGTYNLSRGTLSAAQQYVGYSGTGVFNQTGGSNTASSLYLGFTPSGTGTYNLSRGTPSAAQQYVGYSGTGVFNQTGGSNTASHIYWQVTQEAAVPTTLWAVPCRQILSRTAATSTRPEEIW